MRQPPANFTKRHRWFRRVLLAGVLLLPLALADRGFALNPAKDLTQYNCWTWSRQNGLTASGINAIVQTQDGFLWFGTASGLLRFDGIQFKLFDLHTVAGLQNSYVTSLADARSGGRSGGLWVGLQLNSFGFFDGQSFSFRGAKTPTLNVRSILEGKDGTLWLAAEQQAARLNRTGELETVQSPDAPTNAIADVHCCYEDRQGRVWFGTATHGVYYWQDWKVTKIPDPALDVTIVFSIVEDLDGQIWIGTGNGLYGYDASLKRLEIPMLTTEIRTLLVDRHGVLWIGTSYEGLARYQNGTYDYLQKADGLASDSVRAIAEDREGSLWVGTRDGLSQISDVKFPIQRAALNPKFQNAVSVAASRRGGVWITSVDGVIYFDPKTKTYTTPEGVTNTYIKRVLEARNGDLYWIYGSHELVVFSGGKTVATYAAPDILVGMVEDKQGVVVSAGNTLYRAGTNNFQPYTFKNGREPPFYWILNLASGKDGVIWVASVNGIFRVKDGDYQQWSAAEGLSDTRVYSLFEDQDGTVWAGLQSGIARLKDNKIRLISRKNGLFDDNIYAIEPDDLGNFWVDSSRGISRVTGRSLNDVADGITNQVDCADFDGIESVKVADKTDQERVAVKTADGRIWFPGPHGVVTIDPAHIPTNPAVPPVSIEQVLANGREFVRHGNAVVPPGQGELEFHYTALSFIAPDRVQFRYRLEGYDKDWVDAGSRRMAFYTNLKPGHYTFRVIAANADGVWNETGDALQIELRPHYYQTSWFRLACGGLAFAALVGIYLRRVRHMKLKQQALQKNRDLLETEVRNRTGELAKANGSLRHEIEVRNRMQLEIEKIHKQLLETSRQAGRSEVATNVLHNVGNVLNSVNVSASMVVDSVKKSKAASLAKVVTMFHEHEHDLGMFITSDAKGRQLPAYLAQLSERLLADQKMTMRELDLLVKNIEHIKEIVTMQQSYAKVSGVKEIINLRELVEDSLRMNVGALDRHGVEIVREFADVPPVNVDRHKVLQVLVNLIRNAKHACQDSARADKRLTVRLADGDGRIKISVSDNGVGIAPENLARIFNHGFTTRTDGHGFGLHSGALAAKEMGGALTVHSDGVGQGATFTLELPGDTNKDSHE